MRMWMVDPRLMCRKHLLGEHVELHMLAGSLRRGKSVAGFLERGLLEPQSMERRHEELVREMERRGWRHESGLALAGAVPLGRVDRERSWEELSKRCEECKERGR